LKIIIQISTQSLFRKRCNFVFEKIICKDLFNGILFILLIFLPALKAHSQITPPYYQNFDSVTCTGWSHYAISGTDYWQRGVPTGNYLNIVASTPNVWATNLSGNMEYTSMMALETPDFDLSNMTKTYLISFCHEYRTVYTDGGNVQYSTDQGTTWTLLNGTTAEKVNWYDNSSCSGFGGQPAWSNSYYSNYKNSIHSLAFLQGQSHVRFRFRYASVDVSQQGWMIDNFSIQENGANVMAIQGQDISAAKNYTTITVVSPLVYSGFLLSMFTNTTNYYFSRDNVFDAGDSLIGSKTSGISGSLSSWSYTANMIPNLHAGDYYIFYKHDFNNNLAENNENDNVSYCKLHIDSTFTIPEYKEDFEGNISYWKPSAFSIPYYWVKGYSNIHQSEGTHSGLNSWYIRNISDTLFGYTPPVQYLETPYLDLTPANNNVICFWYKTKHGYSSALLMELSSVNSTPYYSTSVSIPLTRNIGWGCHCNSLSALNTKNNVKIRFKYSGTAAYGLFDQNVNMDDFYIGQPKPDLSIENKNKTTTTLNLVTDTLTYMLFNSGLSPATNSISKFYWSNDSLLDGSDILLATVNELPLNDTLSRIEKVAYSKPAFPAGNYYLIYQLDYANTLDEMHEENNIGFFRLEQVPIVTLPYYNDFENQITGWSHNSSIGNDDWSWGAPQGVYLNTAFSGTKAFHTTANILVTPMSREHLYTPVFDLTTITHPTLEFDAMFRGEGYCHCFNGQINMSYTTDGGATWTVLDTSNQSYNRWYYFMEYEDVGGYDQNYIWTNHSELFFESNEKAFANTWQYNSRDADRNTHYVVDLGLLANRSHVQFRYNIATETYANSPNPFPEGAVIDNFRISQKAIDLFVPYKKSLMISSMNQKIKFSMDIINRGNYMSNPTYVKFYVSIDSILDGSDYYLGQDTVQRIRPDMKYFLNEIFSTPSNFSSYKYLLYQIDPFNTSIESNETNNIGNWPLALDSISTYPYAEDFNDTVVNGWNGYVINIYGVRLKKGYRFRNMFAPAERLLVHDQGEKSGTMFTDRVNSTMDIVVVPYWYLETPSFDFSSLHQINLSFDLVCTGTTWIDITGGNMEYSIDGGNNWQILTTQLGQATNWYNSLSVGSLYNQPGWALSDTNFTPASIDISFLQGKQNVVFRYKYRSKGGMRIDNFIIDANAIDYVANNHLTPVYAQLSQPNVNFNYSITNISAIDGDPVKTKFYWSTDTILDASDILIHTVSEPALLAGQNQISPVTIAHPTDILQLTYYLLYFTDAENELCETSELNNFGSFEVIFDSTNISVDNNAFSDLTVFANGNSLIIYSTNDNLANNMYELKINNSLSQNMHSSLIRINKGTNNYRLFDNIAPGLYFVIINLKTGILVRKIIIE